MTVLEWIRSALVSLIQPDDSIRCDDGQGNVMDTPVTTFGELFGTAIEAELDKAEADRNFYAALSDPVIHTFTFEGETMSMTASEMGYQVFFDIWHIQGLI